MPIPEFPDDHEGPINQPISRRAKITIGVVALLVVLIVLVHVFGIAPHVPRHDFWQRSELV